MVVGCSLSPIEGAMMSPIAPNVRVSAEQRLLLQAVDKRTPLIAIGISAGIMSALKITADKIADVGECRSITHPSELTKARCWQRERG